MNALRQALSDYLVVRRSMGYKLKREEKLLAQYLNYLEERGQRHIAVDNALAWATLPRGGHRRWWANRLSMVRGFAVYLRAIDPATEVPPPDLLPSRPCRATPYLYSDQQVAALLAATTILCTPFRVATYRTLIGLLAATGMRVGEALALDRRDFNPQPGLLVVRHGKFGKERELPVHPTVTAALQRYLCRQDRPRPSERVQRQSALFTSTAGTRLLYCNVHWTFVKLLRHACIEPRSASCRPRIHDLRHSFAVATLLDAYAPDGDPAACIPLLSTYLGHVDPAQTYWYLSAAPELLALAGQRLESYVGGRS